jgi:hypothetical protein
MRKRKKCNFFREFLVSLIVRAGNGSPFNSGGRNAKKLK